MSGIEFNDQQNTFRRQSLESSSERGMMGWLMKKGLASSENAAQIILIAVAVFFFVMSALVFYIL
ncbi:MAG: hypothetical protein WCO12_03770 [bacterium]